MMLLVSDVVADCFTGVHLLCHVSWTGLQLAAANEGSVVDRV